MLGIRDLQSRGENVIRSSIVNDPDESDVLLLNSRPQAVAE
jgi:hypothetical protein